MSAATIDALKRAGFAPYGTGGNCQAWAKEFPNATVLVTDWDDPGPLPDESTTNFYVGIDDSEGPLTLDGVEEKAVPEADLFRVLSICCHVAECHQPPEDV